MEMGEILQSSGKRREFTYSVIQHIGNLSGYTVRSQDWGTAGLGEEMKDSGPIRTRTN